ncbi:MAG TPA: protease pro-enzyme activation domain-containing protein, partial [Terracidiphilus sp.]|nr:protease pro-enzyme activation domain-containing protein [Terracidiphilus sp.]
MTTMHAFTKQQGLRLCGWLTSCALAAGAAAAQTPAPVPAPRIRSEISYSSVTQLANSPRLYADGRFDAGRMPADTPLTGITMVFNRTAAQQADLTALLAAQQNPSSPLFHQWLTPEQFGARFGMAQADLDKVQQWLQQQGFTIDSVARARNSIRFSGTVNRVNLAFQTEMHYYKTPDGARHLSPSTPLSLPSAIAPTIEAIHDLIDLKPRPSYQRSTRPARPAYSIYQGTSPQVVLFAPGDIDIAYDINPLIQSGTTGTGQTIAIMGQSQITTTDITNFQDAALLAEKTPNLILVPNTGAAAVSPGDEGESDLDLEWSGATAPGATIDFVYTGNSPTSNGIFDSLQYAIDNNIGNIISVSYGSCETELAGFTQDPLYQQAEMQGQSIIAA